MIMNKKKKEEKVKIQKVLNLKLDGVIKLDHTCYNLIN